MKKMGRSNVSTREKAMQRLRYYMLRRRADVIFLLFSEVLVFCFLLYLGGFYYIWIRYGFRVLSIIISLYISCSSENKAYKILWLVLLLIFPLICSIFYIITVVSRRLGVIKGREGKRTASSEELHTETDSCGVYTPLFRYLYNCGFDFYSDTSAKYFHSGEQMVEALVSEIKRAEKSVYLEYFIISEGYVWDRVLSAITERARYGVDIRIIIDDMGCFELHPRHYKNALKECGIELRVFNRFRPIISSRQNNRDHRKIAVIDGVLAFTGGINLADEYVNIDSPCGYWKDSAIMLKGAAAEAFYDLFLEMWDAIGKKGGEKSLSKEDKTVKAELKGLHDGRFLPFADYPLAKRRIGRDIYSYIIRSSRECVYISTPYLIPDESITSALEFAALGGADVRLVIPFIPDKKIIKEVGRTYYERLIDAGVKIYEYKEGFNHAKLLYSDGKIGVVGSCNLDYRSMYLNYECGALIYASSVLSEIYSDFSGMISISRQVERDEIPRGRLYRVYASFLRLFAPLM